MSSVNPYPESSVYHAIWDEGHNDGYRQAAADTVLVSEANGKLVRDYLRSVDGKIKCEHVRIAQQIGLTGQVPDGA